MPTVLDSLREFDQARRKAFFRRIVSLITGQPQDLLSFEEVRRTLRLNALYYRGLQQVPLDKIVGSVGRYQDFTREFLPLTDDMRERWARIEQQTTYGGYQPIELYKVGDAYFVRDGNHRVSVARTKGAPDIEAYVWEYPTRVPLTSDVQSKEIPLLEGMAEFLEKTRLDELDPDHNIHFTEAARYHELLEHIDVHRYFLGQKEQRGIPYAEAVESWYRNVYRPAVKMMHEEKILERFPGRTEADLYIWMSRWLYELGERYGRDDGADDAGGEAEEGSETASGEAP